MMDSVMQDGIHRIVRECAYANCGRWPDDASVDRAVDAILKLIGPPILDDEIKEVIHAMAVTLGVDPETVILDALSIYRFIVKHRVEGWTPLVVRDGVRKEFWLESDEKGDR